MLALAGPSPSRSSGVDGGGGEEEKAERELLPRLEEGERRERAEREEGWREKKKSNNPDMGPSLYKCGRIDCTEKNLDDQAF